LEVSAGNSGIDKDTIRAFIIAGSDQHLTESLGKIDNWKVSSPGKLFYKGNIQIHYNPNITKEQLEEDTYILCAYMDSYRLYGTYSTFGITSAKGFTSINIARLINLRTGVTEKVYRKTIYPPEKIGVSSTSGYYGTNQIKYWRSYEDVYEALFG
jgi:hypothetical protein